MAAWNPGTPKPIRQNADGTYTVPSHRGLDNEYLVNLDAGTCNCPHYSARLAGTGQDCKHLVACKAQKPFIEAARRARELTDEALESYLKKYANHAVIGGALRSERARRQQEQRPPIGTSTKTFGPRDDDAAFRGGPNWAGMGEAR